MRRGLEDALVGISRIFDPSPPLCPRTYVALFVFFLLGILQDSGLPGVSVDHYLRYYVAKPPAARERG